MEPMFFITLEFTPLDDDAKTDGVEYWLERITNGCYRSWSAHDEIDRCTCYNGKIVAQTVLTRGEITLLKDFLNRCGYDWSLETIPKIGNDDDYGM